MVRGGGELAALAGEIGEVLSEIEDGPPPPELRALARAMVNEGRTLELARTAFAEARAKRPKAARLDGLLFLLGEAVDELRLSGNGGSTAAKRELDAVMTILGKEAAKGGAEPGMMMALARTLAFAGLAPPAELQASVVAGMETTAQRESARDGTPPDLGEIAKGLGDNPFQIHSEMAAMAAAFPAEHRMAMIHALGVGADEDVRVAGLGFVLDPDDRCAMVALAAAREAAERFSPTGIGIARLVRMRPWLPQTRRAAADELIAYLRRAAPEPEAGAHGEVKKWFATPGDGAGAQSLFALVKGGKMWAIASVLIKHDEGVCDAWVADGMSKREAADMETRLVAEADAVEVTRDFVVQRIGDALARNAEAGPPPFGLVQVLEAVDAPPIPPRSVSPAALCEALLSGLADDQTGVEALARAHANAHGWGTHVGTVESWFEAGETVETLLSPIRGRKKRAEAVLAKLLPSRRSFWAGRLAWTAAALQAKAGLDPVLTSLWVDMALVARAIAGDAPLADMPLMRQIADDTVRVFEGRDF